MKAIFAGAIGLLIGLFSLYVALVMTGAGHGWITPFFFSLACPVLFPLVAVRLARADRGRFDMSVAIIILAVVLDLILLNATTREGVGYMHRVGGIAILWLSLWALWQVVALATLVVQGVALRRRDKAVAGAA
ncbi:hypothetical protein [Sphingomonas sp.]|uniref:hypothetical protein n=1 Tax=Sphingomonas sp. TaxID=28214 RepID=UPI003D6D66DB